MNKKISVIYVTYCPDLEVLRMSIQSIIHQVDTIYIVDNTPDSEEKYFDDLKVNSIHLKENFGIAYAQNLGIKYAMDNEADFVMLSDQDTIYPKNYINDMMNAYKHDENIAAIVPLFNDINQVRVSEGFIVRTFFAFKRVFPITGTLEVLHAIASGKIINTQYLKSIGLMNEELFIDWVDLEWCWRAQKKGFKVVGNADVKITHQLGDKALNIGFREVNLRSYIRHYYMTRNAFYLAIRSKNLDLIHKITFFLRACRYPIAFPLLAKPHMKNLYYSWLGVWHGIIGRLGKVS